MPEGGEGTPELYQRRKKVKLERQHPRPTFQPGTLPTHFRPHRTLPELEEHYPTPWVPPPRPPTPPYMVWDTGIPWDSGWKWK